MSLDSVLPYLTTKEKYDIKQFVKRVASGYGSLGLADGFTKVCAHNMRLVKEVNRLRAMVGEELLPVYELKIANEEPS
jgi:hypothetical protein